MSATPDPGRTKADLIGVSETALLTLNARAAEARRPDAIIDDPMAIALADSIDFDFAKFGRTGQEFALRALTFDRHTRSYLNDHPSATVVALAEGLQTSFWRLDAAIPNGQFRWLTVDLPPVVDLRTRLLPKSPRISMCPQSASGQPGEPGDGHVEEHLGARECPGALGNQFERQLGLQVHQQALSGDEHSLRRINLLGPAVVQRGLRARRYSW